MSPDPENSPPEPPSPEKPKPVAGDGGQGRSEADLWELEAQEGGSAPTSATNAEPDDERRGDYSWMTKSLENQSFQKKENRKRTGVRLNIQPNETAREPEQPAVPVRRVEQEFSQLDDWEEVTPVDRGGGHVSVGGEVASVHLPVGSTGMKVPMESDADAKVTGSLTVAKPQPTDGKHSKSSPVVQQSAPMKMVEWVGLGVLAVLIVALAIGAYFWSIHLLPEKTPRWQEISFPVKGDRVEIKDATTYWRAPVLEGPDKDPIRRGTRLIPILELEVVGGPVALRVIFRDDEGRSVGDPIIRFMPTSGKLSLAATAGFEEPGMHAAYRTEELEPWTVEVSEAASADASGSDFSQILKMNLSSDLR